MLKTHNSHILKTVLFRYDQTTWSVEGLGTNERRERTGSPRKGQ